MCPDYIFGYSQNINIEYMCELKYYADKWEVTFMELLSAIKKKKSTNIPELEQYFIHKKLVKERW